MSFHLYRHDITVILLKVALNTNLPNFSLVLNMSSKPDVVDFYLRNFFVIFFFYLIHVYYNNKPSKFNEKKNVANLGNRNQ